MMSLLTPRFFQWEVAGARDEPVTLGQVDLSSPFWWVIELQPLALLYRFRGYIDVTSFLLRRPELVLLLFEVYSQVARYFGPAPQLVLEVVRDPEIPESDEQLFVLIQTGLSVPEAMALLNALDREWWLDVPWDLRQHVVLDVEHV